MEADFCITCSRTRLQRCGCSLAVPDLRRAEPMPIAGREARYPKLLFHTQYVLESLPEAEQQ